MIPARIAFVILGFFGCINLSAIQVILNEAITTMVNGSDVTNNENACPELEDFKERRNGEKTAEIKGEFDWESHMQVHVVGSYFYGYFLTQIPGGILADNYGGKFVYGVGVFISSLFTFLTPFSLGYSAWVLVINRILVGMGGGVTYPAIYSMVSRWSPSLERSRILTAIYTGGQIGALIATLSTGIISGNNNLGGWPSVFYTWGLLGCLWFLIWIGFGYDMPESHSSISADELNLIQENRNHIFYTYERIPWRLIMTSSHVWALILAHVGENWSLFTLLTMMPVYLNRILYFSTESTLYITGSQYLIVAIFAPPISSAADCLRSKEYFHITTIRKLMNSFGFFGSGLCAIAIAVVGCKHMIAVLCVSSWYGFNSFIYSGFMVNHVDISPQFAGTVFGITSTFATVAGFAAPIASKSFLSKEQTLANWDLLFFFTATVHIVSGFIFVIFASAEQQVWTQAEVSETETDGQLDTRDILQTN